MKRSLTLLLLIFSFLALATHGKAQTTTDTLYFEFELAEGVDLSAMEYAFSEAVLPGIEIDYYDGQEHSKFTPDATGNIIVHGSGHGRIYYSYEESEGYKAFLSSRSVPGTDRDIVVRTLSGIHLTSLDAHACPALKGLECLENALTDLNVRGCSHLETLDCVDNQLTTLDVSTNTALTGLWCYENQLTVLDVSQNPVLRGMYCDNNQLTALDVSQNPDLEILYCSDNQLTTLDVSGCSALTNLDCSDNQLTVLDVSGCTALSTLECPNNQLNVLNISGCTALGAIDCHENQLTVLDVSGCTALMMMSCENNQLTELAVGENLMALMCANNHIPLSTLYGILESGNLMMLEANPQSDTLVIGKNQSWNLSAEKLFGETETTYILKDEEDNEVSEDDYTEDGFVFTFHENGQYTLALQNQDLTDNLYGTPTDVITFTYHVTVEERFAVAVSANNGAWGWATKTGDGTYGKGKEVTIIATPREGYRFVNWIFADGEEFSTEAVYTFAVTEDISLVANFEEIPEEPIEKEMFTVSVYSNNEAWGSVSQSGNGIYKKDSLASITATPAEGYRFVNWMRAGVPAAFCTRADTSFAVTENLVFIANFEEIPDKPEPPVEEGFTVDLSVNNPAWGLVFKTGNCVYGEEDEITIFALPFAGYRFVNWTKEDGSVFGTDSIITFKVTESLELVAVFEEIPEVRDTFSVQVFSNNEAWGTVSQSGDGRYEKDSSVTITATPVAGYRFVGWTQDDVVFCAQADTTFAVTEDMELTAHFERIPDEGKLNEDFYIYVKDGVIHLSEDRGRVEVFNVIGQCLYRGRTTALRVRQNGVYIICIADRTYKVLVM